MEAEQVVVPVINEIDAYVVGIGEQTNVETLKLVQAIRNFGFSADRDFMDRKAKAQFKTAAKLNAKLALTLGETELAEGVVNVKSMESRKEKAFPLSDIYEKFDEVYDEMMTKMFDE